ncbi:MAG: cadherin-like domain-containing protein, partial [Nitrososphaera sp.]|nr:cadherin-like domain-containing protein [Nitrososphaera sp.]
GLGTLTYTPSSEYSGSDSFTFKASDDYGESEPATVTIAISPVNDPPLAIGQNVTATENRTKIALTAFDLENIALKYTIIDEPAHGTLDGTAPDLMYSVIDPDFAGEDSFTFSVSDGESDSNIAFVSISVNLGDSKDTDVVYRNDEAEGSGNKDAGKSSKDEEDPAPGKSDHSTNSGKNKKDDGKNSGSPTALQVARGNTMVLVSWQHDQGEAGVESTLNLQFHDRMKRAPLAGHVWYDLVILDSDNTELQRKQDLVALNSADVQKISFPGNGTYQFKVIVKGLIDKSDNSIKQDNAYTGSALATVVVPEFSSAWFLVLAASIMSFAIVTIRFVNKSCGWKYR